MIDDFFILFLDSIELSSSLQIDPLMLSGVAPESKS
ncbi:hypothetical protein VINE108521_15550 [Vibrio neonatus]